MQSKNDVLAITLSLLGLGFIQLFQATKYYFWGSPPTGFSLGTLGVIICLAGVIVSVVDRIKNI